MPTKSKKNKIKKFDDLKDAEMDWAIEWIVFSLRSTLEDPKVRKEVLEKLVGNSKLTFRDLGMITGGKDDMQEIKDVVERIVLGESDVYVFSLRNIPDERTSETHFQSVIVKTKPREVIWFDPAMSGRGKVGIYEPYAGEAFEKLMLKQKPKYRIRRNPVTNACQLYKYDVFCQSWSLYLQYMYVKNNILGSKPSKVPVDERYINKGKVLLDFYKKICSDVDIFNTLLNEEYKININKYSKKKNYKYHKQLKKIKNKILNVDVCDIVDNLEITDLFERELKKDEDPNWTENEDE